MIEALDTHLENVNTKCELIDINNYKNNWHKVLIIPLSELFNFGLKRNEIMILGGDPEQKMHKNEVKSYQGASQMSQDGSNTMFQLASQSSVTDYQEKQIMSSQQENENSLQKDELIFQD